MSSGEETKAPETVAENVVATPEQDVGARIFIGNIGFRTRTEEITELFKGLELTPKRTLIPRREKRSLGYAFVTLQSPEDASTAISKLDSTEFNGRKINVEIAKPPTTAPAGRIPKDAAKAAADSTATTAEGEEGAVNGNGNDGEKKAGGRRGANSKRSKADDANGARIDDADASAGEAAAGEESGAGGAAAAQKPRRAPRQRKGPPANGTESETGLFISNLNRKTEESTLQELFKEYQVSSLRVSTFNFGSLKGKSRGFAFIHFADREQQQKALSEVNHKEVDGKKISLKVLVEGPERPAKEGEGEAEDGEGREDVVSAEPEDPVTKTEPVDDATA